MIMNAQTFFWEMQIKEKDRKEDSVVIWHFNNMDYSCNAKSFLDWLSNLNKSNIKDTTFKGFNFEFKICEEEKKLYAYCFNNEKINYDYRNIQNGKIAPMYIMEDMNFLKNKILLRYDLIGRCSKTIYNGYEESSIFKFKFDFAGKEFGTVSYESWDTYDPIAILDFFIEYYKDKNGSFRFCSASEPGFEFSVLTGLKIENKRIYYTNQIIEDIVGKDGYAISSIVENHEYLLLGTPERIAVEFCADIEPEKERWAKHINNEKYSKIFLEKLTELQFFVRKN